MRHSICAGDLGTMYIAGFDVLKDFIRDVVAWAGARRNVKAMGPVSNADGRQLSVDI